MQDRIMRKIEEIRQKPEHVRIWYAWVSVGVVMFFVVVIWIFTLQESLRKAIPETTERGVDSINQLAPKPDGMASLDDLSKSGQSLGSETPRTNQVQGADYFNQELTKQSGASAQR